VRYNGGMQPLSPLVRRLYLTLFIGLFFAILPATIFYADGWRYKSGFGFVRTGGVYISVPYPDADVMVNGQQVGRSGFLDRNFYLGDLAPASYTVHVEREGYLVWERHLIVEEQLVTDARAVLLPVEIPVLRLVAATSSASQENSTTTRTVSQSTITEYTRVFSATTTASSTIPVDEQGGVGLFIEKGSLVARWIQENAFPLSHFCERPSACTSAIVLEKTKTVTSARFFSGGVAYATTDGGVHFREIDIRETPVSAPLFSVKGTDIRVIDDLLIIKSGTTFYEIEL
jgi:hypothetical protein